MANTHAPRDPLGASPHLWVVRTSPYQGDMIFACLHAVARTNALVGIGARGACVFAIVRYNVRCMVVALDTLVVFCGLES